MRRHRTARGAVVWTLLAVAAVATAGPLALAVLIAFASPAQFAASGLGWPDPWTLENLAAVLADPRTLLLPMGITALAALVLCTVQTISSVLAAYAFARLRFPGRRALLWVYLAGWVVPPVVTVLPLYLVFVRAGLSGTFLALVLPAALASPYAILLLRQWFAAIPDELFDAAAIDGAGAGTTLRLVALPLARPAVAAVVLVVAVSTWNAYLWPRLIAGVRMPQVQVAIGALQSQYDANWSLVMAATVLALIPPFAIAFLLQRPFLRTIELQSDH